MLQGLTALAKIPALSYQYNSRKLIYQYGKIKIYHYHATAKSIHTTPLLVIFATVNRPEILDLFPETSFIRGLLDSGMDVYLLDWGYPDTADQAHCFSDYVTHDLQLAIEYLCKDTNQSKINLLGICQGGLLSLCYALLYQRIKTLVLVSTPIDFHTDDNIITKFINTIDMDELIATMGNVSGLWLTQFFISLRPFELVGKKYLRFVDNVEDRDMTDRFLMIEKWLYDAPDQPGNAFKTFAHDFYRDNKLITGKLVIDDKPVDIHALTLPVLNVMAEHDEIIPISASQALKHYVKSEYYDELRFASGHIGIYVSDKVRESMPKAIAAWITKHS